MRRWFTAMVALSLLLPPMTVFAGPVQELAAYFRAASGVVIMPVGDEYLVDLDAAKGAREGDLLAVVAAGEKIVHPVSGEVLGTLDQLKGILQVTQVKSGYSYARAVGEARGIGRGDAVKRWENVPAAFQSPGTGDLERETKAVLPHLDWQPDGKKAVLTFVVEGGRLVARGPAGSTLASVAVESQAVETATAPIAAAPSPGPTAALPAAAAQSPAIVARPPAAPPAAIVQHSEQAQEGIWFSPEFAGEAVGVHVGDVDGDGRQEVAVAFRHRLELGRIAQGSYTPLASLELGLGQKVVAMDGADLDGDGRSELFLTAADRGDLHSLAVRQVDGGLQVVKKNIPWYIRAVHLPGEGRVLLGQRMGLLRQDFAGPIFRVAWRDGEPAAGPEVEVPSGTSLFGFTFFQAPNGTTLAAEINLYDELKVVDAEGRTQWKSDERVGGSESFIERQDPDKNPADGPATRNAFMQARMAVGPDGHLIVPVNEGSRLFSRIRNFDSSRVKAMTWNGFSLQEVWHSQPQGGYLADFRLADADNDGRDELVQALVFSREGMMSKGRSALVLYELP